jgi:hypothetical protein
MRRPAQHRGGRGAALLLALWLVAAASAQRQPPQQQRQPQQQQKQRQSLRLLLEQQQAEQPPKPKQPPPEFPPLPPSRPPRPGTAAALTCACLDQGWGSEPCRRRVLQYCGSGSEVPEICSDLLLFLRRQELPAGAAAAKFLSSTCAVEAPEGVNTCACLEVRSVGPGGGWAPGGGWKGDQDRGAAV